MKRIMLKGDSIRLSYQDAVKALLAEDGCEIWSPPENGRFVKYTLNSLRHWLPQFPEPDVIHWNNGLWDILRVYPEDGCFTDIDEYVRDMGRILRELKKTGAKVIFATTTAVGPGHPSRDNADIERYTARFLEAFGGELDAVDDLYALTRPNNEVFIKSDDKTHLTEEGVRTCAAAVAASIRALL